MDEFIKKADVLIEALPYIQNFYDKTIVIKYGGAAMEDANLRRDVLKDIVFLSYVGMRPILVHGGGPHITKKIEELGKEVKFVKGQRVTTEETIGLVEEELAKINRELVKEILALGGSAISLSGKEDRLIEVKKHPAIEGEDIGFVGKITKIHGDVLQRMLTSDIIPVISPVGVGADGRTYNVNADQSSAEIAWSVGALKLVLFTNVPGIMKDMRDRGSLISRLTIPEIPALIGSGVIAGGMIPKVNACVRALEKGVRQTHIIDVNVPHGILLEIFTDTGIGTEITKK